MSKPSGRAIRVSATSRPPLRWRGWPAWGWLLLALGMLLTFVAEYVVSFAVAFAYWGGEPGPAAVAKAQSVMVELMGTVLVPWVLATVLLRPRLRVALAGLLSTSPAILFWLDVRTPGPWF